ncbi:hypothetical protein Ocin01_11194 [Orchesella cincta]|uniref:Uncharacterized protein n=1 Tax=Orchesella cincta TaxID=48709 RepID=A0A1D2MR75_ORCCI|nr:hypothetical protein Ocin01_11194 [Orchesella cincta]
MVDSILPLLEYQLWEGYCWLLLLRYLPSFYFRWDRCLPSVNCGLSDQLIPRTALVLVGIPYSKSTMFRHSSPSSHCIVVGPYEYGIPKFKHVYFNVDLITLKMWIITVIGVVSLYESMKHFILLLLNKRLRWSMAALFLSSLHSHYYGWWMYWNFLNDDFYHLWYHQVFFTITELISSVLVLRFLDVKREVEPHSMLISRDLAFMTTDVIHACLSLHEIRGQATRKGGSLFSVLSQRRCLYAVLAIFFSMFFLLFLLPNNE